MKKVFALSLIVFIMSTTVAGQEDGAEQFTRKGMNSVYLELAGNGLLLTLNYEKFLTNQLAVRVGGLVLPSQCELTFVGTMMGTTVWGKRDLCMEAGLGVMISRGIGAHDSTAGIFALTGVVGFRYQPKRKGPVVRLGITPFFTGGGIFVWYGASIGLSF